MKVEDLKCCGNCKLFFPEAGGYCTNMNCAVPPYGYCKLWEKDTFKLSEREEINLEIQKERYNA